MRAHNHRTRHLAIVIIEVVLAHAGNASGLSVLGHHLHEVSELSLVEETVLVSVGSREGCLHLLLTGLLGFLIIGHGLLISADLPWSSSERELNQAMRF